MKKKIFLLVGVIACVAGGIFLRNQHESNALNVRVTSIEAGQTHNLVVDDKGNYWSWGAWLDDQSITTYETISSEQIEKNEPYGVLSYGVPRKNEKMDEIKELYSNKKEFYVLKTNGELWRSARKASERDVRFHYLVDEPTLELSNVRMMNASKGIKENKDHELVVKNDSTLWGKGSGRKGQLGKTVVYDSSKFIEITDINDVKEAAAGGEFSVILKNDGSVWTAGINDYGQLGDGTTNGGGTFRQVTNGSNVAAVSAGYEFAVALKKDGTVWAWGRNDSGQLGVGDTVDRTQAEKIEGLSDIVAIEAGHNFVIALKNNGTVWAWGSNLRGELGDGTKENRLSPVKVKKLSGITMISAGMFHSLALTEDGIVYGWGDNLIYLVDKDSNEDVMEPKEIMFKPLEKKVEKVKSYPMDTSIGLEWDVISSAHWYEVVRDGVTVYKGKHPSYLDGELEPEKSYTYEIYALNESGRNVSETVMVSTTKEKVGTPVHIEAEVDDESVIISWTQVTEADGYEVTRDEEVVYSGTETTFEETGLEENKAYTYEIRAVAGGEKGNPHIKKVRTGLDQIAMISADQENTRILKNNGEMFTSGKDSYGQLGNGKYVNRNYSKLPLAVKKTNGERFLAKKIDGGEESSIAIGKDKNVWMWGRVYKKDDKYLSRVYHPYKVEGLENVQDIDANQKRFGAVKKDGTVWVWGENPIGYELGWKGYSYDTQYDKFPRQLTELSNICQIAMGDLHNLFLTCDGEVWAIGENDNKQLGDGTYTSSYTAQKVKGLSNVIEVAAGKRVSMALRNDGTVWMWGENDDYYYHSEMYRYGVEKPFSTEQTFGKLGTGAKAGKNERNKYIQLMNYDSGIPVKVKNVSNILDIDAENNHFSAVDVEGRLWMWGEDSDGQLGIGNESYEGELIQLKESTNVEQADVGVDHTVYVEQDGSLWSMGSNKYGQLGDGSLNNHKVPVEITFKKEDGESDSLLIEEGVVNHTTIELNWSNIPAVGEYEIRRNGEFIRNVSESFYFDYGLSENTNYTYEVTPIINGEKGETSTKTIRTSHAPPIHFTIEDVAFGNLHAGALTSEGTVYTWGDNWGAQLGNGETTAKGKPDRIEFESKDLKLLAGGYDYSFALESDGTVWGWGENGSGTLGVDPSDNDVEGSRYSIDHSYYHFPKKSSILKDFIDVQGGDERSYGLKKDGTVWTWGYFGYKDYTAIPKQIMIDESLPLTNVVAIDHSQSGRQTYAIRDDGTVWAWGNNYDGQLGNGTYEDCENAIQIPFLSDIVEVDGVNRGGIALKRDGTVWTWGEGGSGTLGNGNKDSQLTPMEVPGLTEVVDIEGGDGHVLILKKDGSVWGFGTNWEGVLGTENSKIQEVPTKINGIEDVVSIHTEWYGSFAIKKDGTLWGWGTPSIATDGIYKEDELKYVPVQISFIPDAPRMLEVQEKDGEAFLKWRKKNPIDLTGYHVYHNGEKITEDPVKRPYYRLAIQEGESHTYEVTAVDIYGYESARSHPALTEFKPLGKEVQSLEAVFQNQHASFTWESPFDEAFKEINVYRDGNYHVTLKPELHSVLEDFEDEELAFDFKGNWMRNDYEYAGVEGKYSYANRKIGHNETSSTEMSVTVPKGANRANASFHYMTSSETDGDQLIVTLNGKKIIEDSSFHLWRYYKTMDLPPGTHTFTFQYVKDGDENHFHDKVYIDHLKFRYQLIDSYRDTSVLPGKTYTYTFKTVDYAGNESTGVNVTVETN
jgi:alpha-tubulin suppressor-like RCC1 family protein